MHATAESADSNPSVVPTSGRLIAIIAIAGLVALAAVSALTSMSTLPWTDEVMQIDAAVNLYQHHGWTSTAWQSQSQYEFWAANNPLYTVLIYVWIKLFGLSALGVRSFNVCLAVLIAWFITDGCRRARIIAGPLYQLLLFTLIVTDASIGYVYRSGRADLITLGVVSVLFHIAVLTPPTKHRSLKLFAGGIPLLSAGLQTIPFVALLFVLQRVVTKRWQRNDIMAVAAGCLAGSLLLVIIFQSQHALVAYVSQTFASGYNIVGAAAQALKFRDAAAVARFTSVLRGLLPLQVLATIAQNPGCLISLGYCLLLSFAVPRSGDSRARQPALLGLIAGVLIPWGMLAAGRYAFYYAWMGSVPVAICFAAALERCDFRRSSALAGAGMTVAVAAIGLGLPRAVWSDVTHTPTGSYDALGAQFRKEARAGDQVYADPMFYYFAKDMGLKFYSVTYAGGRGYKSMSIGEVSALTLALVPSSDVANTMTRLGGHWSETGRTIQAPGTPTIVVLRRNLSSQ